MVHLHVQQSHTDLGERGYIMKSTAVVISLWEMGIRGTDSAVDTCQICQLPAPSLGTKNMKWLEIKVVS
jgi:hypothetical protein